MTSCYEIDLTPPTEGLLNDYQMRVAGQMVLDPIALVDVNGNEQPSSYGYPEDVYHLVCLREEFLETLGIGGTDEEYGRLQALVGPEELDVTKLAVARHLKEFGDLSWHVANFLTTQGIALGSSVELAPLHEDYEDSTPYSPFDVYCKRTAAFIDQVEQVLAAPSEINSQLLAVSAGRLVSSIATLVEFKFGVSYETVLEANVAKVQSRRLRGTALKSAAIYGDDR